MFVFILRMRRTYEFTHVVQIEAENFQEANQKLMDWPYSQAIIHIDGIYKIDEVIGDVDGKSS